MQAPHDQGGQTAYNVGTYTKIVPYERLEFTQSLADKDGKKINPAEAGMPDNFPSELNMVVTFRAIRDGMTELTVSEYGWTAGMMYVMSYAGMNQSLDKLITGLK